MQSNSRDRILTQLRFVVLAKLIWIRWEWDTAWPHSRPLRHGISKIPKIPCNSFWVLLLALSSLQLRSTIRMDKQARGTHNMITLILLFVVELRDIRCVCVCVVHVSTCGPHSHSTPIVRYFHFYLWNVTEMLSIELVFSFVIFGIRFFVLAVAFPHTRCIVSMCLWIDWLHRETKVIVIYWVLLVFVGFSSFCPLMTDVVGGGWD